MQHPTILAPKTKILKKSFNETFSVIFIQDNRIFPFTSRIFLAISYFPAPKEGTEKSQMIHFIDAIDCV